MNKILIVEDEKFLVQALKDNLKSENYIIDIAANGDEAIEQIKKQRPNLILLDLLMPKRDGFYVLEELKKNSEWKTIPVVVLSNLGDEAHIERALKMGANDYFIKSQHSIDIVIREIKKYFQEKNATNLVNTTAK